MEKPVVGYIRVSTEEQSLEGISLDAQVERLRSYCRMKGLHLGDVLEDPGISAAKPLSARPAGARLLQLVQRKRVSGIVAYKLDRVFRNCVDCLTNAEAWQKAGVALHLVDLGGQAIDTSSAIGKFFLTVMAGAAELERNQVAERTSMAMRHKAARGEYTGGLPPYGFTVAPDGCTLQQLASEQEVLCRIAALRASGTSVRKIVKTLENEGVRGCTGRPLSVMQVWRIVQAQ